MPTLASWLDQSADYMSRVEVVHFLSLAVIAEVFFFFGGKL